MCSMTPSISTPSSSPASSNNLPDNSSPSNEEGDVDVGNGSADTAATTSVTEDGANTDWLETAREEKASALSQAEAVWPRKGIVKPHPNDVMYGRGGGTNHHLGNKRYRKMVEDRKHRYVKSKRLEKPLIAFEIIRIWRSQDPPGRFLKKDRSTGLWNDVGDAEARKKTSQALREHAPTIRGELEENEEGGGDFDDFGENEGGDSADDGGGTDDVNEQFTEYNPNPPSVLISSESSYEPPTQLPMSREEPELPVNVNIENVHMDEECADSLGALFPSLNNLIKDWEDDTSERERLPSFGNFGGREHSLGENPLAYASVSQSALDAAFDKKTGAWATATSPNYFTITKEPSTTGVVVKPPPAPSSSVAHNNNRNHTDNHSSGIPPQPPPPQPRLSSDLEMLQSPECSAVFLNSEEEFALQNDLIISLGDGDEYNDTGVGCWSDSSNIVCNKDVIKRATSNQNETIETKRYLMGNTSVKRVALNRDGTTGKAATTATGRFVLGECGAPPPPPSSFCVVRGTGATLDEDREMRELTQTMEKSTLEEEEEDESRFGFHAAAPSTTTTVEPWSISKKDRVTTMDFIAMDLMQHPLPMSRTNTADIIDSLAAGSDIEDEGAFVHNILNSHDV